MKNILNLLWLVFLALFTLGNCNAAIIANNFTGQFIFVDSEYVGSVSSLSSLSLGAVVSGTVTYEDSLIADVGETFIGQVNSLSLIFGMLRFTEADDIDYALDPIHDAEFLDGSLTGIGFYTDYLDAMGEPIWELHMSGDVFDFIDFENGDVVASGTMSYVPTAAPLPASVWLFGFGLIGLVAVSRRSVNYAWTYESDVQLKAL